MNRLLKISLLLALAPFSAQATSITINNGGFEIGTLGSSFVTKTGTQLAGWTVTQGSIDHIGTYWTAAEGSKSIDMNGNSQGAIQQTIAVAHTGNVKVDFQMAGNPAGAPALKTLGVSLLSLSGQQLFTFSVTGNTLLNMGWESKTATFVNVAAGNYVLEFASKNTGAYGAALDNVRASVPDGASVLVLLGMGLAAMGALRRQSARS